MTVRSIITCPLGQEELTWAIINSDPFPDYHIIIKDGNHAVLLDSDYNNPSGSIAVTAPSVPGNYTYTITVIRDDFGHLSDTEQVLLNVTQIFLSDVFAQNNPVLPGAPFTVHWTIDAANPQSDELVQVNISVTSDQLSIPENNFQALYRHGETGSALFIAPNTAGFFPVTLSAVSRFGCTDVKTIMLQTGDGGVIVNAPFVSISYFPGIVLLFLVFYFCVWLFLMFMATFDAKL